ncbi:MAG: ShlB/FhaC/HecB family hemolysin secretion/activation protein [Phycisphaerae bacterium]|nr:ShlB/FhaC/HecB family hemolysin secretion/activation protein [Phycisphaerae bacterium]
MFTTKSQLKIAGLFSLASAFLFITVLASARDLPASKTEEQELLEQKAAQQEEVQTSPELSASIQKLIEALPEDSTPRFDINTIVLNGNILFEDEELLSDIPAVYNASRNGVVEATYLYDLRPLQQLVVNPGSTQKVSARTIQGLAQYILSVYQRKNYAGIYVYVPAEAFEANGDLAQGTLPVRILEAPVSKVSYGFYTPDNQPAEKSYLKLETLEKWSPVKEGEVANRKKLDDFLNLLNRNPDRYVSAMFTRGAEAESLAVGYNVYEAKPDHYFVQVDNSGTKDIQWRPRFGYINTNLLGFDDKLTAVYQTTPDSTWDEEYAVYGSYDFPIWGPKLRLNLFAGYNEFAISDAGPASFLGGGEFYGGQLRYNAFQKNDWFVDVLGGLTYNRSKINTNVPPFGTIAKQDIWMFTWNYGVEVSKTDDMTDTTLSFIQERSIDSSDKAEMNAARAGSGPHFVNNILTARHSRYLCTNKVERVSASLRWIDPDDRLPSAKMTSFGGMYTIRGYDESEIVADGGIIASLQYEYDVIRKSQVELFGEQQSDEESRKPFLKKLAPLGFVDYGIAKIEDPIKANGETYDEELCSVGGGIIAELGDNFTGTVYYGYPLIHTNDTHTGKGRLHAGLLFRW